MQKKGLNGIEVFLSYKHTGEDGQKTKDAYLAEELFTQLKKLNINTFYADQTIRSLGAANYKMAIDDALDEAALLVVIGTSAENINSNWVRYEWDSFFGDILSGRKEGQVISFIDDMQASDLPRTLRQHECFDNREKTVSDIVDFISNYLKTTSKNPVMPEESRVIRLPELFSYGLTAFDAETAFSENDKLLYANMPPEVAGTASQWAAIIGKYPDFSAVVVDNELHIYGNYSLMGLTKEQEMIMEAGKLADCTLTVDSADNLYKAGEHVGYLLNLSVNPSSESASLYKLLWQSFIDLLKEYAQNEKVFFSKIYYKAFLPEHEAKVVAKGFRFCCKDAYYGNVYVHDMDPESTLQALDADLAQLYSEHFATGVHSHEQWTSENKEMSKQLEMDALVAYMDLWKQIDELFYQPEYIRLKKYFMDGKGIPQNTVEYKMGLAVSEWIRDNLQYSEALLPFIPKNQQITHKQFKERIYSSEIVRDSMKQYQFTTEQEDSVNIDISEYSVNALISFANIWLDIDRLFMTPELLDYKQFFYENREALPADEDLEECETLTIRILSIFKISEHLLKQLPFEFAESYYQYKEMICSSALAQRVFRKYPFVRREIFG